MKISTFVSSPIESTGSGTAILPSPAADTVPRCPLEIGERRDSSLQKQLPAMYRSAARVFHQLRSDFLNSKYPIRVNNVTDFALRRNETRFRELVVFERKMRSSNLVNSFREIINHLIKHH